MQRARRGHRSTVLLRPATPFEPGVSKGGTGPVTVQIGGGEYFLRESFKLEKQDGGTADEPVVYRAADGETVRVIGGHRVPSEAFLPVTDPDVSQRLEPEARGHVVQADLAHVGPAPVQGVASQVWRLRRSPRTVLQRRPNADRPLAERRVRQYCQGDRIGQRIGRSLCGRTCQGASGQGPLNTPRTVPPNGKCRTVSGSWASGATIGRANA